ncbi:alpha-amylase family glycosyl hydrolase [Carboxylicivirga marina]|uniref:Cyclomaltodextrinase C-terminal domain-containing protein n=1 Tax=Carboxylicivirga marina TaxID=2800988 RepID=A0ABS1HGY4_9BACT|nr:alpha-amylase family glycosyl hydrolase [Carboxylicivirga marina]MBK3516932.1 cyclomaltodextrinase C-terminal domain-containing protein [Carboxylicivirga marina]
MKSRTIVLLKLFVFTSVISIANELKITPENWWTHMENNNIVIIVENTPIGLKKISVNDSSLHIIQHYPAANKQFHIIEAEVSKNARPQLVYFTFEFEHLPPIKKPFRIEERKERFSKTNLSAGDVIYQVIPDRFCNGSSENDNIEVYFEKKDRLNPTGIHGGDIDGIISQLDYISQLGCTTLELMPILESNLMMNSYKRLAPTNFYTVDKRLGEINTYKTLINSCQELNLKFIQTFTLHQLGNKHPYFQNMIDTEFFNSIIYDFNSPEPHPNILADPYIPESIKSQIRKHWSHSNFPTLNQENPLVRQLLIQHLIWWTETTGLQYIKIEQAHNNTPLFIDELYKALSKEYNDLTIVADNHASNSSGREQTLDKDIPTIRVNYQYPAILQDAFSPYEDKGSGINKLYQYHLNLTSSQMNSNIIMLDNHILNRAYTNADNDNKQLQMMMAHLFTSPGIPSLYYGTELKMNGIKRKGLSNLAQDFTGGWHDDERNGFTGRGMNDSQKQFHRLIKLLLNWRKDHSELLSGEFIHFYPQNEVYAYARIMNDEVLMVIINNSNNESYHLIEDEYSSVIKGFNSCTEIISNATYLKFKDVVVKQKSIALLYMQR